MKFTIKENSDEEKEKIVELSLEKKNGDSEDIVLVGKDYLGDKVNIMGFKNGRFYRIWSAAVLKGIETDEKGRIKEVE